MTDEKTERGFEVVDRRVTAEAEESSDRKSEPASSPGSSEPVGAKSSEPTAIEVLLFATLLNALVQLLSAPES